MVLKRKFRGAYSEMLACYNAYEIVARNVAPHGDVDVIGLKDGKVALFDIKSAPLEHHKGTPPAGSRVSYIMVHADGSCKIIPAPSLPPPRRTLPPRGPHCRARGRYPTPRSMRQCARRPV